MTEGSRCEEPSRNEASPQGEGTGQARAGPEIAPKDAQPIFRLRSDVPGARRPGNERQERASSGPMRRGPRCGRAARVGCSGGKGRSDAPQLERAHPHRGKRSETHRLDVAGARRPGNERQERASSGPMRRGPRCGRAARVSCSGGKGRGDTPQLQRAHPHRGKRSETHRLDVAGARRPGNSSLSQGQKTLKNRTPAQPLTSPSPRAARGGPLG